MGRTVVRQLDPPRARRTRDGKTTAGIIVVLLLALFGLFSAGRAIADNVGSSSSKTNTHTPSSGSTLAIRDVQRAQAQATALVKAAQDASNSIVRSATGNARRKAASIVAAAHRQARRIVAAVPTAAPAPASNSVTTGGQSTYPSGTTYGSTSPAYIPPTPVPSTYYNVYPTATPAPVAGQTTSPNLSGLPDSWKVVGYGATFGAGPGNAGSVGVLNRSSKTFSGVVVVQYTNGGSASAPFSGLAPGQSLTLPLNGKLYTGGGYRIVLTGLH